MFAGEITMFHGYFDEFSILHPRKSQHVPFAPRRPCLDMERSRPGNFG